MVTDFKLSRKCRWGDPNKETVPGKGKGVIEVSEQVANRLTQDGFGVRVSDINTLEKGKKEKPDMIEEAKKAEAEKAAKDKKESDGDSSSSGKPTGGPDAEIQHKGQRSMAKG